MLSYHVLNFNARNRLYKVYCNAIKNSFVSAPYNIFIKILWSKYFSVKLIKRPNLSFTIR